GPFRSLPGESLYKHDVASMSCPLDHYAPTRLGARLRIPSNASLLSADTGNPRPPARYSITRDGATRPIVGIATREYQCTLVEPRRYGPRLRLEATFSAPG